MKAEELHHQIEQKRRAKRDRNAARHQPQQTRESSVQQHEYEQDVGIDRRELQHHGVNDGRSRLVEKESGVGFVEITLAAADDKDQRDIEEHKNQEGGIDFEAAPQRTHHDRAPTLLGQ